jgi:hypothetical protein
MAKQELTMLDLSYIFRDMETQKKIKTTNPYSGESIDLTVEEFTRYQIVKQAEKHADPNDGGDPMWDVVRDGLDWFRKNNAKAYMVLLD